MCSSRCYSLVSLKTFLWRLYLNWVHLNFLTSHPTIWFLFLYLMKATNHFHCAKSFNHFSVLKWSDLGAAFHLPEALTPLPSCEPTSPDFLVSSLATLFQSLIYYIPLLPSLKYWGSSGSVLSCLSLSPSALL